MGPVGFEPTTKGFTLPRRFRREWTISSPVHQAKPPTKFRWPGQVSPPQAARCEISREPHLVRVGAGCSSLLSRALEPSGSLCTFRRCTGGSAQGCHGATAEGFPEFIPSTSRVSARRHLIDESPALTAVLQAQRAAIVAALSRSEAKQRAARVAVGTTVPGERNLADAAVTGSAGVHRALVPRR